MFPENIDIPIKAITLLFKAKINQKIYCYLLSWMFLVCVSEVFRMCVVCYRMFSYIIKNSAFFMFSWVNVFFELVIGDYTFFVCNCSWVWMLLWLNVNVIGEYHIFCMVWHFFEYLNILYFRTLFIFSPSYYNSKFMDLQQQHGPLIRTVEKLSNTLRQENTSFRTFYFCKDAGIKVLLGVIMFFVC
jgi:hypothetical protein